MGFAHLSCLLGTGFLVQRVQQPESEAHMFQVPVTRLNTAVPLGCMCPRGASREN